MDEEMVAPAPTRVWSLRQEWGRAFVIMMVLSLVAGIGIFVGVRHLVGEYKATAERLERETSVVMSLQVAIASHNNLAHQYVDGTTPTTDAASRQSFQAGQGAVSADFTVALRTFPPNGVGRDSLLQARGVWQASLTQAGLWGDDAASFVVPAAGTARYGQLQSGLAAGDTVAAGDLDAAQNASLQDLQRSLVRATALERLGALALLAMGAFVLGITVYLRRRLARDLLRPVTSIHDGVIRLRSGDYGHVIPVARRDELGELAEAFNEMAGALNDSHRDLTFRATHDSLTGSANRDTLNQRLMASFAVRDDRMGRRESVLFIDVDDFKDVNDTLGHEGGDALLIQLTNRLHGCVRAEDLVARLGGDEFAIAAIEGDDITGVDIAQRVLAALRAPFTVNDIELAVSVSIGVACREADTADAAELLRHADFAMYLAKGAGKGRYQLYEGAMRDKMLGQANFAADLARATASGQLLLEYQPIADLRTGLVIGLEALVRWQHPTLGLLAPADFIPFAEETGEIHAVGCWVLETAIRQVATWRRSIPQCPDLWVSVNVSAFQLPDGRNRAAIEDVLVTTASSGRDVVLEVTEAALSVNPRGGTEALNTLKRHGVRIAIDNFGTGAGSAALLGSLSVDIVKIDYRLITAHVLPPLATTSPKTRSRSARRDGILGLADKLGLDVVATNLEEAPHLDVVRALGCRFGQGHVLARPAPPAVIEALLVSGAMLPLDLAQRSAAV
jgi:diguanylate cyclase (GGDEF)-like protein